MGKKNQPTDDYPPAARPASLATLDPWARLACAATLQALEDLTDPDPRKAVDAFLWFVDPGSTAGVFCGIALPEAGPPWRLLKTAKLSKVRRMARKGK